MLTTAKARRAFIEQTMQMMVSYFGGDRAALWLAIDEYRAAELARDAAEEEGRRGSALH
jgi:hypothetical protein